MGGRYQDAEGLAAVSVMKTVRTACRCSWMQFAAWVLARLRCMSKSTRVACRVIARHPLVIVTVILKSPVCRQVPRFPRILQIGRRNCK